MAQFALIDVSMFFQISFSQFCRWQNFCLCSHKYPVSLNAHDDETRSHLMPVNRKYPLATLLDACKKYPMPGRRLLTFEYILIDGINSSRADAEKLARLLKDQRCKLNLIVFNEYPGSPFKSPSPQDVSAFQQILLDRHFTAMLRKSKGSDILAACGQLSGAATTG